MRFLFLVPAVLVAAACAIGPSRQAASLAYYDFGPMPAPGAVGNPLELGAIEVRSPVWLESAAMQYRLAHTDAAQRQSYANSRWVAPPGQLLEQLLRRALGAGANGGCRLRVELDEFLHVFDQPGSSFGVIETRVMLIAPRPERTLAQRGFSIRQTAATHDARGGVVALGGAATAFLRELRDWLGALERGSACHGA